MAGAPAGSPHRLDAPGERSGSWGGLLRRLGERMTRPADQRDAVQRGECHEAVDETVEPAGIGVGQAESQHGPGRPRAHGAAAIDTLADRQIATVSGTIRAVTLRPRSTVPALVVELYDGSQTLVLVWLGRRQIRGIEPGAYVRATGRVCIREGVPTIFNPAYELLPRTGR